VDKKNYPVRRLIGAFKNQQGRGRKRMSNRINELAHIQPMISAPEMGKNP
jgi:hypothetical protein